MRIILTHEQTDFDGLASILAVHLIDEEAIPVLPRRMNRNVRAFVTLYGKNLPFVDPRDISDKTIEFIYLVDTQSMISIKGMKENTKVYVIDHHVIREENPSNWEVRITNTGANVTYFMEEIMERNIQLSVIEATLLLLGIYEDTGSLTYSRTTSTDIRAAADLLDFGANLSIVNDFINHPLSTQQQLVYDQLRSNAISHTIHGHNILIAPGDAVGMDEELSTIAHKLRDLIDPDAIIMLIRTSGGIQLIARSSNDDIDVSDIANHFGGGGHPRAAASLIKNADLNRTYTELIDFLPTVVHPAITVKEIMSGTPLVLQPETSIKEVALQMQKYGFEGYPVVEDDKILGLVTRRAVDRVLSHKLNLTAESVMEAGNISISPDASIEELQTLMTNSGWGQIPVVQAENNKIIGIVTRTDLLETLSPMNMHTSTLNLAEKLQAVLPIERLNLLKEIALLAQEQRVALYIVGGFVRDLLLGYPSLDFDLVVEGDAIELAKKIGEKFGGRITTHKQFGTAKWFLANSKVKQNLFRSPGTISDLFVQENGGNDELIKDHDHIPDTLDFITARREFYSHPSALPTIERGSIKLDLHRRDFTINTLAIRLDGNHYGNLYDHWGGYDDIQQGLVRVLHSISFVDDPTRMLRAVRYEQRYGFQIGRRTLELLLEARLLLSRVSGDRIRHEIDNIFNETRVIQMMDRLNSLGLLQVINPNLVWDEWIREKIGNLDFPSNDWNIPSNLRGIPTRRILIYSIWLMRLPVKKVKEIISRLRFPRIVKVIIKDACELWTILPAMENSKTSEIVQLFEKSNPLAIYSLFSSVDQDWIHKVINSYLTRWKDLKTYTTGDILKEGGLPPGPHYKEILNRLRASWIDEEITTQKAEQQLLDLLIQDYWNQSTEHS